MRSTQGSVTNIINYSVTKYLSLTFIAIVNNLTPPLTMVVAFCVLKEKIKRFEIIMIVLTVAAIMTTVIGSAGGEPSTNLPEASPALRWTMLGALMFNPFLSAAGTISMRKMKKFHEAVVSWYLNWSILLSSLLVILIMGSGFKPIGQFDWVSWLLSFATGLTGVTS